MVNPSACSLHERSAWFDKLTMRESEDATIVTKVAELGSVQPPLSLMVSLSNHGILNLQPALIPSPGYGCISLL
ncbi:hypothetical protein FHW17_003707 [Phyllobacterium sp. P30BS-XVII]|nr:hypothetical protein [Phyllobacterium sp. P30BS-XVII]